MASVPNPISDALGAQHVRLEDEVVVAGEEVDRPLEALDHPPGLEVQPRVERGLLERDHAVDRGDPAERLLGEHHAAQRRLELERDQRQAAAAGDRLVVRDRDRGVQRRALVGRDREHEQAAGPGAFGALGLLDGLRRELGGQPGDDRDVARLLDRDRRTRTRSSGQRCGPSPVSALIASATGPWGSSHWR